MKIKSILSALLLMVCTMASAQKYLNVKLEDGTYRSFVATPKMEISFDKTAKEEKESGNTIVVNGYVVTIQTADGIDPYDILTKVYVDGNNVVIRAFSETGQHLKCTLSEGTFCPQSKTDKLVYTFTLSDIESDVTATIGYANSLIVNVTSNNAGWGTASYKGDCYEGETITLVATINEGKFVMWQDAGGNTLSKDNPYTVTPLTTNLTVKAIFNDGIILPGEFTVNGSGKKVKFSKGNLYYDSTKPEWKFEKYQYDFRTYQGNASCINGVYNANGGTPTNHWGLFGWVGNSSTTFTAAPQMYGVSTSTTESDYGTVGNENLKSDWGKVMGGTWYTLTVEEWTYLLESRTNASSKFGLATVCGVKGLIILPDAFTDPKKNAGSNAFVPYVKKIGKYNDNVYTTGGNWDAMETAGAVFLPATGHREGTVIKDSGQGRYWSSSTEDYNSGTSNSNALFVYFSEDAGIFLSSNYRFKAKCVRLVTNAE